MAITKPIKPTPQPSPTSDALDKFIQGAPDGSKESKKAERTEDRRSVLLPHIKEATEQITLRLPLSMLARLDRIAARQGIPRASYIKRAISMQLLQDEPEDK